MILSETLLSPSFNDVRIKYTFGDIDLPLLEKDVPIIWFFAPTARLSAKSVLDYNLYAYADKDKPPDGFDAIFEEMAEFFPDKDPQI
ncbi:unnamed protein product [marine sediment metagenome]|uniref:Uncharacterized protein n=1 Tax=marine sediment metagenome TaxID=412755 RepID=X1RN94_9ZZZZ